MNSFNSMVRFIVVEGALLAGLFLLVAGLIAFFQQSLGQRFNAMLGNAPLQRGAAIAAVAGAITPFCSCSTVPVVSGMLRAKIRFGICFTFLIASPVINEGVLLVLLREYAALHAFGFLLVAFAVSMALGIAVEQLGFARYLRVSAAGPVIDAVRIDTPGGAAIPMGPRLKFAAIAASNELRSAAPYLAVGLLLGALIYGYVPTEWLQGLQGRYSPLMLVVMMAVLGLPFYVNSAMVVPIALALLGKGIDIGPVAAFLVSAAGTSIPEMILLAKLFQFRLVAVHVVTIVIAAIVVGVSMNWLMLITF